MLHLVFEHSGHEDGSRDVPASENGQLVVTLAHDSGVPSVPTQSASTPASAGAKTLAAGTPPRLPVAATVPLAAPDEPTASI